MAKRTNKRRKTAFVPRVIFATAMVGGGVVPACVAACGGPGNGQQIIGGEVAICGFCDVVAAFEGGLADNGAAVDVAAEAFGDVTLDAFVAPDDADASIADAPLVRPDAVADQAFGSGDVADVSIDKSANER